MTRFHLKLFFRLFRHEWQIYALKVITLSIAFACFVVVGSFVSGELTVNEFASEPRSFRVLERNLDENYTRNRLSIDVPDDVYESLRHDSLVAWSRTTLRSELTVLSNRRAFPDQHLHTADTPIAAILQLDLIEGRVLDFTPGTVMLSEYAARLYFGDETIVGSHLGVFTIGDTVDLRVVAVYSDVVNAHEQFFGLIAHDQATLSTLGFNAGSFGLYGHPKDHASYPPRITSSLGREYFHQPLTGVYFGPRALGENFRHGDTYSVLILVCIMGLICFLALANYANLTTLTLPGRSTEFAIKKVAGAQSIPLFGRLLQESLLICLIALSGGVVILFTAYKPLLRNFDIDVVQWVFNSDLKSVLAIVAMLVVTVLAPLYPALKFVFTTPTRLLSTEVISFPTFRKAIAVVQMGISLSLIVAGLVVQRQISRSLIKEPGLNHDQIVYLHYPKEIENLDNLKLGWRRSKAEIVEVTAASQLPNNLTSKDPSTGAYRIFVDGDFLPFFDVHVVSGHWFGPNDQNAVVINEIADRRGNLPSRIGVVAGFGTGFHQPDKPVVIQREAKYEFLMIRIMEVNIRDTYQYLNRFFREVGGNEVFIHFLDPNYEASLRYEDTLNRLSALLTVVAGVIACCAIYALSLSRINDSIRQIAIRKTFGASNGQIIYMLSQDFVHLLAVAVLLIGPIAVLLLQEWLRNFAYAARLKWSDAVVALVVCLAIVGATNAALILRLRRNSIRDALQQTRN